MSVFPIERYRLILRHELVTDKNGEIKVHEIDEPIVTEYCVDRRFNLSSAIVVNEMLAMLKEYMLKNLPGGKQES